MLPQITTCDTRRLQRARFAVANRACSRSTAALRPRVRSEGSSRKAASDRPAALDPSVAALRPLSRAELESALSESRELAVPIPLDTSIAEQKRALLGSVKRIAVLSRDVDSHVQLHGRIKSVVSTAEKMLRNGLGAQEVLDGVGIRAVTEHTHDCYRLIRRIHSEFPILAGEYDDYVAAPKSNGYRSLHTTILAPGGWPIELQVRTSAMHAHAERGTASHVRYKILQASVASRG